MAHAIYPSRPRLPSEKGHQRSTAPSGKELMEKALTKRRSARRIVGSSVLTKPVIIDGRTLMKLILLSICMQEILLRWILNMC